MTKAETTNLLRALAKAFEQMSDTEYEQILDGSGKLAFSHVQQGTKRAIRSTITTSKIPIDELNLLVQKLQACSSRDEARKIIQEDPRAILKESLLQLAKLLQVHTSKQDRREELEDKIIQKVVGVRLGSEAVLNFELKT